jgi:hypothetical protein
MPTFNGADMQIVEEMQTYVLPKDRQLNAYPGVNGLESLDMGLRGGQTTARGVLGGTDLADLASVQGQFRALQADGGAYTLVDSNGTEWPDVILVMFRPTGKRFLLAGDAGICQRYEMEFLHLDFG